MKGLTLLGKMACRAISSFCNYFLNLSTIMESERDSILGGLEESEDKNLMGYRASNNYDELQGMSPGKNRLSLAFGSSAFPLCSLLLPSI